MLLLLLSLLLLVLLLLLLLLVIKHFRYTSIHVRVVVLRMRNSGFPSFISRTHLVSLEQMVFAISSKTWFAIIKKLIQPKLNAYAVSLKYCQPHRELQQEHRASSRSRGLRVGGASERGVKEHERLDQLPKISHH